MCPCLSMKSQVTWKEIHMRRKIMAFQIFLCKLTCVGSSQILFHVSSSYSLCIPLEYYLDPMLQEALFQDTLKDLRAYIWHHLLLLVIARKPQSWVGRASRALYLPPSIPFPCLPQLPEAKSKFSQVSLWLVFFVGYHTALSFSDLPPQHLSPFVPRSWTFWSGNREQENALRTFPVKQSGSREENSDLGEVWSEICDLWSRSHTGWGKWGGKRERRGKKRQSWWNIAILIQATY